MRSTAETTHPHISDYFSVLPDDDIHDQHVSNQPHHAHYGVERGYDDRYENRVGVVVHGVHLAPRLREARGVVAFGEVPTYSAVVVKRRELAPVTRVRTVHYALHRPLRTGAGGLRASFASPQVPVGGLGARDAPLGAGLWFARSSAARVSGRR